MAKVTKAVRKGRICYGTNLALHKSCPARFEPLRPYPAHGGGAEGAEEAVEASHGHRARGRQRLRPQFRVIQICACKPQDSLERPRSLRPGQGVALQVANRSKKLNDGVR